MHQGLGVLPGTRTDANAHHALRITGPADPVRPPAVKEDPQAVAHPGGCPLRRGGTAQVFLHVGPNIPFRGRLYYCAGENEVIVNRNDDAACFQSAAEAIIAMFMDAETVPGPGPAEMVQASRLLECLVRGGSDGEPRDLAHVGPGGQ